MQHPNGHPQPPIILKNTHSQNEKNKLAKVLSIVCAVQKQYGKTQAELEAFVEGYSMILAHRSIDDIIAAIEKYVQSNPDIPAPADIENIINPPEPKIDWALYVELKKRMREGRTYVDRDEKAFVANCENLAILRQKREMEGYAEAKRQLEAHEVKSAINYDGDY